MKRWIFFCLFFLMVPLLIGGCPQGEEIEKRGEEIEAREGFQPFSFAIITDVHVGYGFSDYGAEGFADYNLETGQAIEGNEGDFNFITDRLEATVNWLNANYQKGNIKFLVILGDISDTAEMSEFFRAKKILDNLEIPYIPIMGNHDVWSHIGKPCLPPGIPQPEILEKLPLCQNQENEIPCNKIETEGQSYFEEIFWSDFHNGRNIELIKNLFGNSWQRQEEMAGFSGLPYYQNYAFSYQGINFLGLDYARRDINCMASLAAPFSETKTWLKENLEKQKGEIVITFSHIPHKVRCGIILCGFLPPDADYLAEIASENNVSALNFAGHIHNWQNINKVFGKNTKAPVIVTKGLMGKTGELKEKEDSDFLRIVKIKGPKIEDIDYNKIITIRTGKSLFPPIETPERELPSEERELPSDIAGTYVNPEDRREYLELGEDGSFIYRAEPLVGAYLEQKEGEWEAKGNEVTLTYYWFGFENKAKGKVKGNTITVIDQDNQVWAENWIKEKILKKGGNLSLSIGARYLIKVLDHYLIDPGKNPRLYLEYQNISEEPIKVRIGIWWTDRKGFLLKEGQENTREPIWPGEIERLIYPVKPDLAPEKVFGYLLEIHAKEVGIPWLPHVPFGPEIEPEELLPE